MSEALVYETWGRDGHEVGISGWWEGGGGRV